MYKDPFRFFSNNCSCIPNGTVLSSELEAAELRGGGGGLVVGEQFVLTAPPRRHFSPAKGFSQQNTSHSSAKIASFKCSAFAFPSNYAAFFTLLIKKIMQIDFWQ